MLHLFVVHAAEPLSGSMAEQGDLLIVCWLTERPLSPNGT